MPSKFFSTLPREPGSDCASAKCVVLYRPVFFISSMLDLRLTAAYRLFTFCPARVTRYLSGCIFSKSCRPLGEKWTRSDPRPMIHLFNGFWIRLMNSECRSVLSTTANATAIQPKGGRRRPPAGECAFLFARTTPARPPGGPPARPSLPRPAPRRRRATRRSRADRCPAPRDA